MEPPADCPLTENRGVFDAPKLNRLEKMTSAHLAMALTGEQRVNAHAIFIAEPDVAEEMKTCMPAGHAHLVMDTTGMPLLLKNIFARAVLATGPSKL